MVGFEGKRVERSEELLSDLALDSIIRFQNKQKINLSWNEFYRLSSIEVPLLC